MSSYSCNWEKIWKSAEFNNLLHYTAHDKQASIQRQTPNFATQRSKGGADPSKTDVVPPSKTDNVSSKTCFITE